MERARMKSYEDYRKWVDTEVLYDTYLMEDAEYVFISYGSSARILRDAVRILRSRNIKAGLFRAITVFPFPEKQIQAIHAKAVLTVEMAMPPMFHDDVRLHLSRDIPIAFYNRCGGNMVNEVEAAEKMCEWIERIG